VANFLYEGDAPLAERRAHALTLDHAQLLELLGEPELRELLDADAVAEVSRQVARLDGARPFRDADDVHDLLRSFGDLATAEIMARRGEDGPAEVEVSRWLADLEAERRAIRVRIAGGERWIAAEDAGRFRDGIGVSPPQGLPSAFLAPVQDPLRDILSRWGRTRGPFTTAEPAARYGLGPAVAERLLHDLAERGRVVPGHFLPGGSGREWCDADVLKRIKRRSLARLRAEIEPVEPAGLARFLERWHGLDETRRGPAALRETLRQLQGAPIPASDLETRVLARRIRDYDARDLDALGLAGDVVWRGTGSLAGGDGRIALYFRDQYALLAPEPDPVEGELQEAIVDLLSGGGGVFFHDLVARTGAFAPELLEALWDLVWAGHVTNDTLAPLRSRMATSRRRGRRRRDPGGPRRPGAEGRWSLLPVLPDAGGSSPGDSGSAASSGSPTPTERLAALVAQLLERHGVLTRESVRAETVPGGFAQIYPVLKTLEEAGRVRRGYFVEGLGAAQFAVRGAEERLRRARPAEGGGGNDAGHPGVTVLAATDPANPWGAALSWPDRQPPRPGRAAGARVVLDDGALRAWVSRSGARVLTFLPEGTPDRERAAAAVLEGLSRIAAGRKRRALVIRQVDGVDPAQSALADALVDAGYRRTSRGWQIVAEATGARG
jgi:ATP-dependent Lhr-like helicase